MTERDFVYWLQGYFELALASSPGDLNEYQVRQIKNHLNMVFIHSIDPQAGDKAEALNEAHTQGITALPASEGMFNTSPLMRC